MPAMAAGQPTNIWQMYPVPTVGASLLAIASYWAPTILRMYADPVGASPAGDGGLTGNTSLPSVLSSLVGAGLLAKASGQSMMNCLTHRFREQAHSHLDCIPDPECLKDVSFLQNLPTMFSGCPSDVRSLACVGRCKFSGRAWKPEDTRERVRLS